MSELKDYDKTVPALTVEKLRNAIQKLNENNVPQPNHEYHQQVTQFLSQFSNLESRQEWAARLFI